MGSPPEHPLTWLADRAADSPDAVAIAGDGDDLSYAELWAALGRWHAALADAGLAGGELLAVLDTDRRRVALATWLACYAGCPVLPLDPQRPAALGLLASLGVRQLLAEPGRAPPGGARVLPVSILDDVPAGASLPPSPLPPRAPQLLIATSGTEGRPKAVMLSAGALAASAALSCELFDLRSGDRWLCCLPLVHVGGLMIFMRCARAGATALLRQHFDPQQVSADLTDGVTHASLSPTMLHCLLDAAGDARAPASLRQVLIGGAPLPAALAARAGAAGWRLTETYGMTETATHVAIVDPQTRALRPLAGASIDLVDLGAGEGEPGRLRLGGPTLMLGYANPALTPGDGLDRRGGLLTADLGRRQDDGDVRLVGREDDVIICGGLNVHPVEVEQLLATCPDIGEVAVTGRPDPIWGHQLAALYTGPATVESCREWAGRCLPGRFRPRAWRRVDALPKNPMGKVERRRLAPLLEPAAGPD